MEPTNPGFTSPCQQATTQVNTHARTHTHTHQQTHVTAIKHILENSNVRVLCALLELIEVSQSGNLCIV